MATNRTSVQKKTSRKKKKTTEDLIEELGLDDYGKKYKYLQKTYDGNLYNDGKTLQKIDEAVNEMIRSGNWKIKNRKWVTAGGNNMNCICSVLYEYKGAEGGILQ